MATRSVRVRIREYRGTTTYLPDCKFAEMICAVSGRKNLSERMVRTLKELGYKVEGSQEKRRALEE
jgi:hypothetical protein